MRRIFSSFAIGRLDVRNLVGIDVRRLSPIAPCSTFATDREIPSRVDSPWIVAVPSSSSHRRTWRASRPVPIPNRRIRPMPQRVSKDDVRLPIGSPYDPQSRSFAKHDPGTVRSADPSVHCRTSRSIGKNLQRSFGPKHNPSIRYNTPR